MSTGHSYGGRLLAAAGFTALGVVSLSPASPAAAASPDVVISEVYGGGGNTGSTFRNDFIELYNRGASAVAMTGWSVQYASATGTTYAVTNLSGTLDPGQRYLIQEAAGTGGTTSLPTADALGNIAMSGTAGKVALRTTTMACAAGCSSASGTKDFVGYGTTANDSETAPTPAPSNTSSVSRTPVTQDTDNNSLDFVAGAPTPENRAAGGGGGGQPVVPTCPGSLTTQQGTAASAGVSASDADGVVTSAAITSAPVEGITLDTPAPAGGNGQPLSTTLRVASTTPAGTHPTTVTFTNSDTPTAQTATCTVNVTVTGPVTLIEISAIQQARHVSTLVGQSVSTSGIVTAVRANGYYLQDPTPDADPRTSEGIFVFTSTRPVFAVGDAAQVTGTVSEFDPGGAVSLSTTQLTGATTTVVSSGNPLPAAVELGTTAGRPTQLADDDPTASVEDPASTFDIDVDGIDYYESLEGMRVQVTNGRATGPTSRFNEIPVVPATGTTGDTARGGIALGAYDASGQPTDVNPERIILDDAIVAGAPAVNVGDTVTATGVMDYSFNNYKLQYTAAPTALSGGLTKEVAAEAPAAGLTIATYNVENLDPSDGAAKFSGLATQIVTNLKSPDLILIEEVQDNNGATNDAVVDATTTYDTLISAISAAGGPAYQFRNINPVDDQDGGEPGGNIRVGFLFRTDRGLGFVDRPGGTSTTETTVVASPAGPQLSASPGRIKPGDPAFASSRKPLAGEFTFQGRTIFAVANHFNSKGGDQPLFGANQPPSRSSEVQRAQQAAIVNDFVGQLRAADPNALVVVGGDINDFQFSQTLAILKGDDLVNMVDTLPANEQYDYVFEGNSQALDHILVTPALKQAASASLDIVHVNAEFAGQLSDHDPEVLALDFTAVPPTAIPEVPFAALFPLSALGLAGLGFLVTRRRRLA